MYIYWNCFFFHLFFNVLIFPKLLVEGKKKKTSGGVKYATTVKLCAWYTGMEVIDIPVYTGIHLDGNSAGCAVH